jgi:hypothetical protein
VLSFAESDYTDIASLCLIDDYLRWFVGLVQLVIEFVREPSTSANFMLVNLCCGFVTCGPEFIPTYRCYATAIPNRIDSLY